MPDSRLQKTRDAYKDPIPWCMRGHRHIILNSICVSCKKPLIELQNQRAAYSFHVANEVSDAK